MERWLAIEGYEDCYEVSSDGRVRSLEREVPHPITDMQHISERILKHCPRRRYATVALCRDGKQTVRLVHHLVLEAFVGPRPLGMVGCHFDDNRKNNTVDNLRWDTLLGNAADSIRNGRQRRGSQSGMAKLTEEDVLKIRTLRGDVDPREIAKLYGVSWVLIYQICRGQVWRHVGGAIVKSTAMMRKVRCIDDGVTYRSIRAAAAAYGANKRTLSMALLVDGFCRPVGKYFEYVTE